MVDVAEATNIIAELGLMKFFPSDSAARTALVRIICGMATDTRQVRWLVDRALVLYPEWPGINEIRACFCSRFRPADGHEADSTVYLEGVPSERGEDGALPPLPPGRKASADRLLDASIANLAARKRLQ